MNYVLFNIGPLAIHGYGFMIAIGLVVGFVFLEFRTKREKLESGIAWTTAILCLIFGFIGGKLLYMIVEWEQLLRDPLSIIGSSGFVVYGGIITGVITALIFTKAKKVSFFKYFDLIIPEVAICQGFGRIGCFMAGCCYGREAHDGEWGVCFPSDAIAPSGVSLIPTQIYSAIGNFAIAAVLMIVAYATRKKENGRMPGLIAGLYLIMYSVGRFIIEIFRSDFRGSVGPLSTSQFISIFILAAGIAVLIIQRKRASKYV